MNIKETLIVVGLSMTFAGFLNTVLYQFWYLPHVNLKFREIEVIFKHDELINQERWQLKRKACLQALYIADGILSNYTYPNVKSGDILPQEVTTEEVRLCFNELACTCDKTEVINILKKILYGSVRPDIIVDLRNAVRRELEFGNANFDTDRDNAFVGKIGADPKIKK